MAFAVVLSGCATSEKMSGVSIANRNTNDLGVVNEQLIDDVVRPPQSQPKPEIRLVFTGDIMLGRHVGTLMRRNGNDYPFRNITLKNPDGGFPADELSINLEGTINGDDPACVTCMSFSFADGVAAELARQGVTAATLANNHGLDRGESGYQRTRQLLLEVGITPFGKLRAINDDSFVIREVKGKKIGYIGFAVFPPFDEKAALELIAKSHEKVDWLFIMVHWGNEYQANPTAKQKELAHAWIDAGADAIIGHHPHVPQPLEEYNGKPIFYSLGNTVFDQYWSEETQRGKLAGITLQGDEMRWQEWSVHLPKAQPKIVE